MSRTLTIPADLVDPRLPADRLAAVALVRLEDPAAPVSGERRDWLTKVQRVFLDPHRAQAEAERLNALHAGNDCRYFLCQTQIQLPGAPDAPPLPKKD